MSILYQELSNLDINKVNELANKGKMKKQFENNIQIAIKHIIRTFSIIATRKVKIKINIKILAAYLLGQPM